MSKILVNWWKKLDSSDRFGFWLAVAITLTVLLIAYVISHDLSKRSYRWDPITVEDLNATVTNQENVVVANCVQVSGLSAMAHDGSYTKQDLDRLIRKCQAAAELAKVKGKVDEEEEE